MHLCLSSRKLIVNLRYLLSKHINHYLVFLNGFDSSVPTPYPPICLPPFLLKLKCSHTQCQIQLLQRQKIRVTVHGIDQRAEENIIPLVCNKFPNILCHHALSRRNIMASNIHPFNLIVINKCVHHVKHRVFPLQFLSTICGLIVTLSHCSCLFCDFLVLLYLSLESYNSLTLIGL